MEVMHAEGCEGMEGGLRKSRTTARPDTPGKTPQILLDCGNINVEKRSTRPFEKYAETNLGGKNERADGQIRKQNRGRKLTRFFTGQRPKNQTHLLQGQGLQKAHTAQGDPIQGRKGTTKSPSRAICI
jgi:hypothetical protein